jgi:hypothetical protein
MTYKSGDWGKQAKKRSKHRKKYFTEYRKTHPVNTEWNRNYSRIIREKFRKEIFNKFGNKCIKCGFSDIRALQIDHVYGGGDKERKIVGNLQFYRLVLRDTTGKYQLLCANCNWIKRIENNEFKKRIEVI